MTEPVQVGQHQYRIGKLDVFEQLKVAKRIVLFLPLFSDASAQAEAIRRFDPSAQLPEDPKKAEEEARKTLTLTALSQLPDADSVTVVNTCLTACHRENTNKTWSKVIASSGSLMFQDITLQEMMELTYLVIQENLGSFFSASLVASPDKIPA